MVGELTSLGNKLTCFFGGGCPERGTPVGWCWGYCKAEAARRKCPLCAWMACGVWQKWVLRDGGSGSSNQDAARGWMWLSELRLLRQTE